MTFSTPRSRSD